MGRFDREVKAPTYAFKEATRTTPDLGQGMNIIPLSLGGGLVWIILSALICWGFGISARGSLVVGGFATGIIFLALWVLFIRKELYHHKEKIEGHAPQYEMPMPDPPKYEFTYQRSPQTQWRSLLPAPEPVLMAWIDTALGGGSLSYAAWEKRFASRPGLNDGAARYRTFRQALVKSGWAIEKGTHSLVLTERGEEALEEWQVQHPDPIPLLDA